MQVAAHSCFQLTYDQAPAPGFHSRVVEGAARAAALAVLSFLAHSYPPSHLTRLLDSTVDRCKILTYTWLSETLPFRIGLSPLAGVSSAAIAEGMRTARWQRAQSADGGDVGASLPRQRAWWRRVRMAGTCLTRVCVPASSEPASRVRPSSHISWGLVCAAFARPDAQSSRLRAR